MMLRCRLRVSTKLLGTKMKGLGHRATLNISKAALCWTESDARGMRVRAPRIALGDKGVASAPEHVFEIGGPTYLSL